MGVARATVSAVVRRQPKHALASWRMLRGLPGGAAARLARVRSQEGRADYLKLPGALWEESVDSRDRPTAAAEGPATAHTSDATAPTPEVPAENGVASCRGLFASAACAEPPRSATYLDSTVGSRSTAITSRTSYAATERHQG